MKKNPHMNERVKKYQNKRGIQYATADGALYKALKVLYIIAFAVNILFNVFYILVKLVSLGAENSQSSDISGLIQISVFTAALIAGLVLTVIHRTRWVGRIISMAALGASAALLFTPLMQSRRNGVCPYCGAKVSKKAAFCPSCGKRLAKSAGTEDLKSADTTEEKKES